MKQRKSCRLTGGGNDKPGHSFAFWLFIQVTQGKNSIFHSIAGDKTELGTVPQNNTVPTPFMKVYKNDMNM